MGDKIKVGVGFITGRKNFINVLKANFRDWKETGLIDNPNVSIEVFITYDLKFSGVAEEEFKKIPIEIVNGIESITFIGEKQVRDISKEIYEKCKISKEDSNVMFGTHGYSKMRNTIVYSALKKDIDYLLFLDDDEYPYAVKKDTAGNLKWVKQSTLLTHLKYILNSDVTYGYKCGYTSPIPYIEVGKEIDEKVFSQFIDAMKNNDTFGWKDLRKTIVENKGITYGERKEAYVVKYSEGGRWVWGTNVCLNLKRLKNVPPFYNPPDARGEDAFFSTNLKNCKVIRVPVYNFHDPFLQYTYMADGIMPKELKVNERSRETVKRFLSACIGWMRYKPLLMYVSDKKNYQKNIDKLYTGLNSCLDKMALSMDMQEFNDIKPEIDLYVSKVKEHYKEFKQVKNNWKLIVNNMSEVSSSKNIKLSKKIKAVEIEAKAMQSI